MSDQSEKNDVRSFYDHIGWKKESDGFYQNARYEDLRPISAEYIHRCHMRITPHLSVGGKYLADIGSGPIQYPEYLSYSENYTFRVCLDISITALEEARARIKDHGLFVVCDAAKLPFSTEVFDGIVSLHTFHHLPLDDQKHAWAEVYRTLKSGHKAAIVNGWTESAMMKRWQPLVQLAERLGNWIAKLRGKGKQQAAPKKAAGEKATGTYIQKLDAAWVRRELPKIAPNATIQITCWRSVSVRWLRALIHKPYGKVALRRLFTKESAAPEHYGEYGQYPLIILQKNVLQSD